MGSIFRSSAVRYLLASLAGLALDFLLYLTLIHQFGVGLTLAAALSFFASGAAFYFVHEMWTFRRENSKLAPARMIGNLAVLIGSGLVRVTAIAALEVIRQPDGIWVSLYFFIAAGISIIASFFMNRFIVFSR